MTDAEIKAFIRTTDLNKAGLKATREAIAEVHRMKAIPQPVIPETPIGDWRELYVLEEGKNQ